MAAIFYVNTNLSFALNKLKIDCLVLVPNLLYDFQVCINVLFWVFQMTFPSLNVHTPISNTFHWYLYRVYRYRKGMVHHYF